MTLQDLEYILKIAQLGSLSQAARELGITQSAMSHVLRRVEKEFQGKIFSCGHSGAVPTEFGRYFLEEGEKVLWAAERFRMLMQRRANPVEYQLRIGIAPFYERRFLPPLTEAFADSFPFVNIEFTSDRQRVLEKKTKAGDLDFAMVQLPERTSEFACEELFRGNFLLILSEQHPLLESMGKSGDRLLPLSACRGETLIFDDDDTPFQKACIHACEKLGFRPQCISGITSPDAMTAMAANKMGIGFLPEFMARERAEGIAYCRIRESLPRQRFGIIFRKDAPLPKIAQEFIRIARKEILRGMEG